MDFITYFQTYPQHFLVTVGVLSLFIGSFLNVVIYRLPRMMERSWSEECRHFLGLKPQTPHETLNLCLPASHCPQCKHTIRPWHNIPLVSYLWLRGKCPDCHTPIAWLYPFIEALTAILSVIIAAHFGVTLTTLAALLFTWILISLTFIDIERHLLPDQLTLSLMWIGLFTSLFNVFCTSQDAILGAIAGYLIFASIQWIFYWATGKVGMGQGDYKFLAALGAFFGWQFLPFIIFLASVSGIFFTLIHMALKKQTRSQPLPFGPYLALAGWIVLLHGNELMQTYYQFIE